MDDEIFIGQFSLDGLLVNSLENLASEVLRKLFYVRVVIRVGHLDHHEGVVFVSFFFHLLLLLSLKFLLLLFRNLFLLEFDVV